MGRNQQDIVKSQCFLNQLHIIMTAIQSDIIAKLRYSCIKNKNFPEIIFTKLTKNRILTIHIYENAVHVFYK